MRPCISIGFPVYNGERFCAAAMESLLGQTCQDFEIIICDNASTDRTAEICRSYLADRRVQFHPAERNRGAAWNFNRSFAFSRGRYFKWMAHDDLCRPEFLERCLEVLEADSGAVLCYPREAGIDEQDRPLGSRPYRYDITLENPWQRVLGLMLTNRGSPPVFGLIRSEVLRRTRLIGPYDASDQVLLAELAMHGRLAEVPEELLLHREHSQRSVRACPGRRAATAWFDTSKAGKLVLPTWRVCWEYCKAVLRSPVRGQERLRCLKQALAWGRRHRAGMLGDLAAAWRQCLRIDRSPAMPAGELAQK